MVEDAFAIYEITTQNDLNFPYPIKEYQRYVFGDDEIAHRYGTDLAKALIAKRLGLRLNPGPIFDNTACESDFRSDFAVAIITSQIPTATNSLRDHFTTYLTNHLLSTCGVCAIKVDIHRHGSDQDTSITPTSTRTSGYYMDSASFTSRRLIIISDVRIDRHQESAIRASLESLKISTPPLFVYLAMIKDANSIASILPVLSDIIAPSMKDIEALSRCTDFVMNESFVDFVMGQEYSKFCRLVRLQDDDFTRRLLDYAIIGKYHDDVTSVQNFKFLQWEVSTRNEV